jgi:hypothetical protein
MSSSHALKYNILINTSIYGGVFVFALYSIIILLVLLVFDLTWLTIVCSIILLIIAIFAGKNTYAQTYSLRLSDRGEVELILTDGIVMTGKISGASFYNGFCVYLYIQANPTDLSNLLKPVKKSKKLIVIYKDAVNTEQYRMLARLIHTGRS